MRVLRLKESYPTAKVELWYEDEHRLGLKPIVLILNNEGYGTMRNIREGRFNTITQWNYGKITELVGAGESTVARTKGELDGAIRHAMGSRSLTVIDVRIPRDDMSPQLASMSAELSRLRGAKKVTAADAAQR